VDCVACLEEAWATFFDMLDPESRIDATWLLDTVRQATEAGIKKSDLLVRLVFLFSLYAFSVYLSIGLRWCSSFTRATSRQSSNRS
jgi:hypothetical protein